MNTNRMKSSIRLLWLPLRECRHGNENGKRPLVKYGGVSSRIDVKDVNKRRGKQFHVATELLRNSSDDLRIFGVNIPVCLCMTR